MLRSIMIIGGGLLQLPAVRIARTMGLRTIVTDFNEAAPGLLEADVPVALSTRDVEGTVAKARELKEVHNIQGVLTVGTDFSVTVAAVANSLGLPGIRYEDSLAATDKILMRQRFLEHNVPSPRFEPVREASDLEKALEKIGFPCVIKPSDNMGARGVRLLENLFDAWKFFDWSRKASFKGILLVEEYMAGPELSLDALVYNNEITFSGIADRIIEYAPYFVETGHNMPSALPSSQIEDAKEVMRQGIRALGIAMGAAKGDIKITQRGAMIGELAARLSGGFMSAYTYPYSSGVEPIRGAIQIALGEKPEELKPKWNLVCIERAILDRPGIIKAINGLDEALQVPGLKNIFLTRKVGDESLAPKSNMDKLGNMIAVAESLAEAEKCMQKARALLTIEIQGTDDKILAFKKNARHLFNGRCIVCKVCDGEHCASGVPGMGGSGEMRTFRENTHALDSFFIRPRYIGPQVEPEFNFQFLGQRFQLPVFAAPVTGLDTNMGGKKDEPTFISSLLQGTRDAGSLAFLGDGSTPGKYKVGLDLMNKISVAAAIILKPQKDNGLLREKISYAREKGVLAWGMDIDSFFLKTMVQKNRLATKTVGDLASLRAAFPLPMIIKGILSGEDALLALDAGADCIIVSNHGGRTLDGLPPTIEVLPEIVQAIQGRIPVLIDGGFRSGAHVFTALCLGANAVLIGRPVAIYNMGGGVEGVSLYFNKIATELKEAMMVSRVADLSEMSSKHLIRYP